MRKYNDTSMLNRYIRLYNLEGIVDDDLRKCCEFEEYKTGELICELGEPLVYFRILLEGSVKVFTTSEDGKILSLTIFDSITNIGDIELMTETSYRCNVEVIADSLCLAFPVDIIKKVGFNNNSFLRYICKDLCTKFDDIGSVSSIHILYPLRNRLVHYILKYKTEEANTTIFPFSHKDLAELLGTTYRHLTRSFNELESKGLIRADNGIIHILKEDKLRNMDIDVYPHKN